MTATAAGSERTAPPTAAAGRRRLGHVPALDGFRGVAVVLVMLVHVQVVVPFGPTGIEAVDRFIQGGFLGVDLFFVLSGFLITALLLGELDRRRSVSYRSFYARRALRLLPALYLFLLAQVAFAASSGTDVGDTLATSLGAVLYVNNWQAVLLPDTLAHQMGHLWSLSVEEQFYAVWPFVLVGFFGLRTRTGAVAAGILGLVAAVAAWRLVLHADGIGWIELFVRFDTRADSLLVGALLACLWVRGRTPRRVSGLAWGGLAVVIAFVVAFRGDEAALHRGGFTVFAVAAAAIVLGLADGSWIGARAFEWRPLQVIGRVSYGLYLWHYPVFRVVGEHGAALPSTARVAVALAVTTALVAVSWRFVEQPALALKERVAVEGTPPQRRVRQRGGSTWLAAAGAVVLVALGAGAWLGEAPSPTGSSFVSGDADRSSYWALAGLTTVAKTTFDGSGAGLEDVDGLRWEVSGTTWRRMDGAAVAPSDPARDHIAVLPGLQGDNGLSEIVLRTVAPGAGIVFRYADSDDHWSVEVAPDGLAWVVSRTEDGQTETVSVIEQTPHDGVTVTVVQNGPSIRVLLDGTDRWAGEEVSTGRLRSGLFQRTGGAGAARWDRFLLMAAPG